MGELVSVIVPVYNVENYLERCVNSIINQTYQNLEIILIDDGSTDGSGKLCEQFASNDTRIITLHKENGGLSSARNAGIDICKGRYIVFVDSDDYINEQMIERLYNEIICENADIVICDFNWTDENGIGVDDTLSDITKDKMVISDDLFKYLFNSSFKTVVAWNKIYRRELFEEIRYPEGKVHEDEFVIHHLLYESKKIVLIPEKLYHYIQHRESITGIFNYKRVIDVIDAFYDRYSFLDEKGLLKYKNIMLDILYDYCVNQCEKACLERYSGYQEVINYSYKTLKSIWLEINKKYFCKPKILARRNIWMLKQSLVLRRVNCFEKNNRQNS